HEKLVATMLVTIMTVGAHREVPRTTNALSAHGAPAHSRSTSPRWCPCRRLRAVKTMAVRLTGGYFRHHTFGGDLGHPVDVPPLTPGICGVATDEVLHCHTLWTVRGACLRPTGLTIAFLTTP